MSSFAKASKVAEGHTPDRPACHNEHCSAPTCPNNGEAGGTLAGQAATQLTYGPPVQI